MAELAINNAQQESIQNIPFMLSHGQHPQMPAEVPATCWTHVPAALTFTQEQQFLLNKAEVCLNLRRSASASMLTWAGVL